MNWLDYIMFFGPAWFLSVAILIHGIIYVRSSKKLASEVKNGASAVKGFTLELREDMGSLKEVNVGLKEKMVELTQTLRRIHSFYWPFGGKE